MKTIINYIIKFIQSISLVVIVFACIMLLTIFNKHYVYDLLENNNYYEETYDVVKERVSEYLLQSGLPESTLDSVITESLVKATINNEITSFYNNQSITIDTIEVEEKLTEGINTYITENNIKGTSTKTINALVEKLVSVYKEEISYNNALETIRTLFIKTFKIMKLALSIACLLFILTYVINRFLFRERNLIVSLFTCFLILQMFILYVKNSIDIENISFYNTSISSILKEFINSVLYNINITSLIVLIIGITLALYSGGLFKSLRSKPKVFHSILLVVWMIVIFSFSQANGITSTKTSDLITEAVVNVSISTKKEEISHEEYKSRITSSRYYIRKAAHFIEYMILGILVILLLNDYAKLNKRMLISALLFCTIYAIGDEVHQLFIDGRSARAFDCLIDVVGSTTGILIYLLIKNIINRRTTLS